MKPLQTTILAIIFCASVFAQENQMDVIYLTNGNVIRGIITEKTENQFVRISTTVGNFVFRMNDIEKIEKEPFGESSDFAAITENIARSTQTIVRNEENIVARTTPRVYIPQEIPAKEKRNIEHSVFWEFFGSSGGVYNIGYDCAIQLAEMRKIAMGTGFHFYPAGQNIVGSYLQINYLYGKKHHLEVGAGLTFPEMFYSDGDSYKYHWNSDFTAHPFVRIGYRFQESGGLFFRAALTPFLSYNKYDQILYIGLWGGVAFGFTL